MKDATQHRRYSHLLPGRGGWLSKVLGALLAVGIIVAAAALAAFFFGFFLVIAAIASVWLAWQRWRLRRRARAGGHTRPGAESPDRHAGPRVIQGEYEVVEEHRETRESSTRRETQQDRPRQ